MNQISSYINQANEELEAATLLLEKIIIVLVFLVAMVAVILVPLINND
ncbi:MULTISPECIES: hypothetical protein [Microcystis]|uniref:Uncharacterized protein n=1 Tax=Microcystis aeruginosa PCC 9443 TaxID=1160281 RepID=I4G7U0_MICAE|nr:MULTISPECIES: hypothetical protein [Microcystis]MCZ8223267.1 hypothetical protein [Microcystis sp. LE19-84.1B]CCI04001.1 hypothetical protein MICAC_5250002 [Microcystis aeruginosa PCC 9443]